MINSPCTSLHNLCVSFQCDCLFWFIYIWLLGHLFAAEWIARTQKQRYNGCYCLLSTNLNETKLKIKHIVISRTNYVCSTRKAKIFQTLSHSGITNANRVRQHSTRDATCHLYYYYYTRDQGQTQTTMEPRVLAALLYPTTTFGGMLTTGRCGM